LLPLALGFIGIAVSGIQGSRASASICFDLFEQQLGTKLKSGAESFDLIETLLIKCLSEGMKSFPTFCILSRRRWTAFCITHIYRGFGQMACRQGVPRHCKWNIINDVTRGDERQLVKNTCVWMERHQQMRRWSALLKISLSNIVYLSRKRSIIVIIKCSTIM